MHQGAIPFRAFRFSIHASTNRKHKRRRMTPILAREYIRRMPGGSQSHLLRASDNKLYVVKFVGNPQGTRILCNELLASLLARDLGLSVPKPTLIIVPEDFVRSQPELTFQLPAKCVSCMPGVQFASTYICDSEYARMFDAFPESQLTRVQNAHEIWGAAVFDTWVVNSDVRQAVYYRTGSHYRVAFIDQGGCFGGSRWRFPISFVSSGFKKMPCDVAIYESLMKWLSRIENLAPDLIHYRAAIVPKEWYAGSEREFGRVVKQLIKRQPRIRMALARHLPVPNREALLGPAAINAN